jgi:hypothetical protein
MPAFRIHSPTVGPSSQAGAGQPKSACASRRTALALSGFALALFTTSVAACRPESRERSDREAESRPIDTSKAITLTAIDYAFDAPEAIPAGWTTFRLVNRGTQLHTAQLVRLEEGHTLSEFLVAYEHAWRTIGPRPKWGKRMGGPGAVEPNGSSNATMYLEPGNYAWYCPMNIEDGVPHVFGKGMARPFVVQPPESPTPKRGPQSTLVIQLSDYAFTLSAPVTAGRHVIKLENVGVEPHELGLIRLAPGKTLEDFRAWARDFQGPPPGQVLGGVNALATGAEAYFEVELTPGDYVLLCFVTAPDGRPHADHGMIQGLRVR